MVSTGLILELLRLKKVTDLAAKMAKKIRRNRDFSVLNRENLKGLIVSGNSG